MFRQAIKSAVIGRDQSIAVARCARPRLGLTRLPMAASPVVISFRREGSLMLRLHGRTGDHRSHAAPESGTKNHPDMNYQEEQKSQRNEKMNRARRLLAAQ